MILESLEMVIPEPLVMSDPLPHRTEPRGDKAIAPFSAMPLLGHETGIKQDAEMLRNSRAAHLELCRNRVDSAVGLDKEIEHPAPRGMADCPEDILFAIESRNHGLSIGKD
jgi:hypothetical protein